MDLKSFIAELGKIKPDRSLVTLTSDGLTVSTLGGYSVTLTDCYQWDRGFIWLDKATLSKMVKILRSLSRSYPNDCLNLTMQATTIGEWELKTNITTAPIYCKIGESDRPSLLLTMGGSAYNIAGIGDLNEFAAAINRPDQFPKLESNVSLFSLPSEFFHLAIKSKLDTAEILCRDGKLHLYCPASHHVLYYEQDYCGIDRTARIDIAKIKTIIPKNGPIEFSTTESYHGLLVGSRMVGDLSIDLEKMKVGAIDYCRGIGDNDQRLQPEWFSLVKSGMVELCIAPNGEGIAYGYEDRSDRQNASVGQHGFSHTSQIDKIERIAVNSSYVVPMAIKSDIIDFIDMGSCYTVRGRINTGAGYVFWVIASICLRDRRPLPSHWPKPQKAESMEQKAILGHDAKKHAPQNAIAYFEKAGKWPKWFRPSIRVRSELALLGLWPHSKD